MAAFNATVVVESRVKASSYSVVEANQSVRDWAMSNSRVKNRYAFKSIEGRGDLECSKNDKAIILSEDTKVIVEDATSQALSLPCFAALRTTSDRLMTAKTAITPYNP